MPKLTDPSIRNAQPSPDGKPWKLYDEGGLYLLVQKRTKAWRFRYRLMGKDQTLALGKYPAVSLKDARAERDRLAGLVARGIDPLARQREEERKAARTAGFEAVAREWLEQVHKAEVGASSYSRNVSRLERLVLPWLGNRPLDDISPTDLRDCLMRIADGGRVDTAQRTRALVDQVYRYAIVTERATRNVAADLKGTLPSMKKRHYAAPTGPAEVGALLRAIEGYNGSFPVLCALRFHPYVFVRPGELRQAQREEIDLDSATWTIPAEKMKMKRDHVVPLSRQAVAILRDLHPLTGSESFVFTARKGRPLSINTLSAALRSIGYSGDRMTPHGWRATARTLLDEVLHERPEVIEHQLAHATRDPLGRAYGRMEFLEERRRIMQRWADYLDGLRKGGEVVPFSRGA